MTDIRKLLAANIKSFRNELGLTQPKLAERVGVSTHHIAMIEVCKNFPSPEVIERIAEALEKDTVDLFTIAPVHKEWQETVLAEMEKLIACKLSKIRTTPNQPIC